VDKPATVTPRPSETTKVGLRHSFEHCPLGPFATRCYRTPVFRTSGSVRRGQTNNEVEGPLRRVVAGRGRVRRHDGLPTARDTRGWTVLNGRKRRVALPNLTPSSARLRWPRPPSQAGTHQAAERHQVRFRDDPAVLSRAKSDAIVGKTKVAAAGQGPARLRTGQSCRVLERSRYPGRASGRGLGDRQRAALLSALS